MNTHRTNLYTLDVVVGGQFGSEAKGHTVEVLAERRFNETERTPLVIRVAGPNAGHTGYDSTGQAWALRQVPVAAVNSHPVTLAIAPGSEIDMPVLLDELTRLHAAGLLDYKRVYISGEATLIETHHKIEEADAALIERAGSTGKGIGAARADRLMRRASRLVDSPEAVSALESVPGVQVIAEASKWLADPIQRPVIVEGTQGYGLGLHAGFYPQCTSSDVRAIDFLAMAGVNPWQFDADAFTVWVVARVYPIRVAGNSGPLRGETSWAELGLPEELTTVTQKVRRVGEPDWALVSDAVWANGSSRCVIALTMVDQYDSEMGSVTDIERFTPRAWGLIGEVQEATGADVALVCTGPNDHAWVK